MHGLPTLAVHLKLGKIEIKLSITGKFCGPGQCALRPFFFAGLKPQFKQLAIIAAAGLYFLCRQSAREYFCSAIGVLVDRVQVGKEQDIAL